MKEVSSKFQEKMQDSLRSWVPKIEIDGNEIPCDIKTGLTINLGSCGPEEFNIGAVFVPSITATISDCSVALQNKEIKLYMGLVLDDGTIEYVPVGYFTVEKPNKGKFDTSFTAYGRLMSKMGGLYESELTYPATINSVITEISTKTGVKINLVGLTGTGLIPIKPTELNYRETIQMIAGLLGGFVTENSEGEVVICKYELDDALTVDTAICYEYPFVHDENYSVTGLSVNTGTEEFSYGTPNINMTNGYMTASLFETCKGNVMGFSYMPGSVKFLGDIRLDPWNSLKVTDDDNEYQIPCMDIVHIWDGGLITTVQAPGTTEAEDESGFSGSIKTIENKLSKAAGVTGALETLFEIDKTNGTIKLQAGKLLEILSGGQLIVEADNYSLNEDGTVAIKGGKIGGFTIGPEGLKMENDNIYAEYDFENNPWSSKNNIVSVEGYPEIGLFTSFIDAELLESYTVSAQQPSINWNIPSFKASIEDKYYMTNITKATLKLVLVYSNDGNTISGISSYFDIESNDVSKMIITNYKYVAFGFVIIATGNRVYIPNPSSVMIGDYAIDFFSDSYNNADMTYIPITTTYKPKLTIKSNGAGAASISPIMFRYGVFVVNRLGEVLIDDEELETLWPEHMK